MRRSRTDGPASEQHERGSVLMLVPAAVLVLFVLGAIAVDSAAVFLAQRDLANRTAAVANDIAASAISDEALYRNNAAIELDQSRALRYVDMSFAADRRPAGYLTWSGRVSTSGRTVRVEAEAEVQLLFAPAIPGVHHTTTVHASATAVTAGG
jgi:Flp pilus assembly protein TadG